MHNQCPLVYVRVLYIYICINFYLAICKLIDIKLSRTVPRQIVVNVCAPGGLKLTFKVTYFYQTESKISICVYILVCNVLRNQNVHLLSCVINICFYVVNIYLIVFNRKNLSLHVLDF